MTKQSKLILLAAFNDGEDGELLATFDPREFDSEEKAKLQARLIADRHAGVIAWSGTGDPDIGEFGLPTVLFQHGKLPEME